MSPADKYEAKIRELCERSGVKEAVSRYIDEESKYAALSFNMGWQDEPYAITSHDLLTLNFLGIRVEPLGYRQLIDKHAEIEKHLRVIDDLSLPLWKLESADDPVYKAANEAWKAIRELYGFNYVVASKLLARKRPHLIPILDRWVEQFYDHDTKEYWLPLAEALRAPRLIEAVKALRPSHLSDEDLSVIRTLDIAIWMTEARG